MRDADRASPWPSPPLRPRALVLASVLAVTLGTTPTGAHVAPSIDDNNRYLKLTPSGDRVRFAYTVFFGEVPGAAMRPSLDTDRDRTITEAEGRAFGGKLAREVAANLELVIDGTARRVEWAQVAVGMATPEVAGGAFSVDLIGSFCLGTGRGRHTLQLRDRFRIPRPGETEIKVEDSPGVTIESARIGQADDPTFAYRFVGPGGPLADDGLALAFVVSDRAPGATDAVCAAGAPPRPRRVLGYVAAIGGVALALVLVVLMRRRAT